jgi:zinc transporter ZupT
VAIEQTSVLFIGRRELAEAQKHEDLHIKKASKTKAAWPEAVFDDLQDASTMPSLVTILSPDATPRKIRSLTRDLELDMEEEEELSDTNLKEFCHNFGWDGVDDTSAKKLWQESTSRRSQAAGSLVDNPWSPATDSDAVFRPSLFSVGRRISSKIKVSVALPPVDKTPAELIIDTKAPLDRSESQTDSLTPNSGIRLSRRASSKQACPPEEGLRLAGMGVASEEGGDAMDDKEGLPTKGDTDGDAKPLSSEGGSSHGAVMVWLGILIDAIPESMVIGILVNKSAVEGRSQAAVALPFVISVFLSNLPEAMSSSGSMKCHGIKVTTILLMWSATTAVTAIGALIGAVVFPPEAISNKNTELVVTAIEGFAAGAMLTMIAQTMMPEAFEQGGDIVGLCCLAGFLCSMSVKLIPV